MGGIRASLYNFGILFASLYPLFIVCFLVVASIFNFKLNGIIYLGGIIATIGFCLLVGGLNLFPNRAFNGPITCDLLSLTSTNYTGPNTQAAVCWFTFAYLMWPMMPPAQSQGLVNPMILIFTLFGTIINSVFQYTRKCSDEVGIFMGIVIGLFFGTIWFWMWFAFNRKDLLFFNELVSSNAVCSRPNKQTFKCSVYKGGELLSSTTL